MQLRSEHRPGCRGGSSRHRQRQTGFPWASPTPPCPSAGHLSQGLLSLEHGHLPGVFVLTLLSVALFPPAIPIRPGPAKAAHPAEPAAAALAGRTVWVPSAGPGPGSTHRPPAAAAAAGAGAAAPWAATGGGAGPGSGAVLGGAVCRCEPQPGGPAIKGGFLPRAGSPRAPVRAVLSIWPEGRSCRWKSRRELGAVTRAAERGAGAGVTPRSSPIGAASPLLRSFLLWQLYFLSELQQFLGNLIQI